MKRTVVMALAFAIAVGVHGQGQITLKLECSTPGPTFRFTLTNAGPQPTNIVIGALLNGRSWVPQVQLRVNGQMYSPGTIGPQRRMGGFTGRIDDIIVPLPAETSYAFNLQAELFGGLGEPPLIDALAKPTTVSAFMEAGPILTINSGQEGLRLVKVWTGKLSSASKLGATGPQSG